MLSIIIPAYNAGEALQRTVAEAIGTLQDIDCPYEIIIVNDGSTDDTFDRALLLSRMGGNVKSVGYSENRGKGFALKYGFKFTSGELVLFLDADRDLPPAQIPTVMAYMERNNSDIVIGSKRHPESKVQYPAVRRFLSKGYSLLIKLMFNLSVRDTQTGIKLFRREVLERVLPVCLVNRYAFDLELLASAKRMGYDICEAPVQLNFRFSSRIRPKDILVMLWDTVFVFYRMRILPHYRKQCGGPVPARGKK